jgi:predicted trehalose synthase
MILARVADNQIAISLSAGVDVFGIERLINYAKYLEATAGSQAQQADIDALADEVNTNWWNRNKQRFLK